jgi:hypothetical protein
MTLGKKLLIGQALLGAASLVFAVLPVVFVCLFGFAYLESTASYQSPANRARSDAEFAPYILLLIQLPVAAICPILATIGLIAVIQLWLWMRKKPGEHRRFDEKRCANLQGYTNQR